MEVTMRTEMPKFPASSENKITKSCKGKRNCNMMKLFQKVIKIERFSELRLRNDSITTTGDETFTF